MKASMIDYTEEKVALAKELGLDRCAEALMAKKLSEEQTRKEVAELTNLKFKPISKPQIEKMLNNRVFKHMHHTENILGIIWSSVGVAFFLGIDAIVHITTKSHFDKGDVTILSLGTACVVIDALLYFHASFPKMVTSGMKLTSWAESLPRGALLAVKEAKEAGLADFNIYYPTLEGRRVYKADPVITGKKPGITSSLMVHAWDDGKVRD